jgi:hypothetical protein
VTPRNTNTGGVLEAMVLPALTRGGYASEKQVAVGTRCVSSENHAAGVQIRVGADSSLLSGPTHFRKSMVHRPSRYHSRRGIVRSAPKARFSARRPRRRGADAASPHTGATSGGGQLPGLKTRPTTSVSCLPFGIRPSAVIIQH